VPVDDLKANGSILSAAVTDQGSPVVYGYDSTIPVYYRSKMYFKLGIFDEAKDQPRPSGRGSKADPDVPQGRSYVEKPERPKPGPGEEGFQLPDDFGVFLEPYVPKMDQRPRVIVSFAKEADQLLLSGMLDGGDAIAGKPIVVDSPLGKGHVLLFANNPLWRSNSQGEYALIFNA